MELSHLSLISVGLGWDVMDSVIHRNEGVRAGVVHRTALYAVDLISQLEPPSN